MPHTQCPPLPHPTAHNPHPSLCALHSAHCIAVDAAVADVIVVVVAVASAFAVAIVAALSLALALALAAVAVVVAAAFVADVVV